MLIRFTALVLSLLIMSHFLPGIQVANIYTASIIVLLWGLANITIKPLLILLTLPIQIITLGLSSILINAFIFWFLSTFIQGFTVENFLWALIGTFIISIVNTIVSFFD
jgi:putative membrane protein